MPEYRKDPLRSVAGRVGKDPTQRNTSKGTVVGFSIAVPTGYDDGDKPTWYDVSVFNEGLQISVMAEISKGVQVAVEGFFSEREYPIGSGKIYPQLTANRVGLVEFLNRTQRQAAPAAAPAPVAAPVTPTAPVASTDEIEALKAKLAALQGTPAAPAAHPDDLPF